MNEEQTPVEDSTPAVEPAPVEDSAPAEEAATEATEATETVDSDEAPMFTGVIVGGWGYVAAAWSLSLAVLLVYVAIVTFRLRGLSGTRE